MKSEFFIAEEIAIFTHRKLNYIWNPSIAKQPGLRHEFSKLTFRSYSFDKLIFLVEAPTGIPCLWSTSVTTSFTSGWYESKSKTLRTTLAKPSSGKAWKSIKWNKLVSWDNVLIREIPPFRCPRDITGRVLQKNRGSLVRPKQLRRKNQLNSCVTV